MTSLTPVSVLRLQGAYYILTGLWPLLDMASFEAVTGAKTDDWLVWMVALLAVAIGATLAVGASGLATHLLLLSVATALSFTVIDVIFSLRRVVSFVYLGDAVVEISLILALAAALRRPR
jgi:hypothetical protein